MIHIYYGYGKGKTTAAVGLGVRAKGAGLKVLLVQFLKDNKSSELSSVGYDVYKAPEHLPFNPSKDYQKWVDGAVDYVKNADYDVIILDEFLDVIGTFVSEDTALSLLDGKKDSEIVITGHKKVDTLFEKADYITSMQKEKHPYDKGVGARKGIEF